MFVPRGPVIGNSLVVVCDASIQHISNRRLLHTRHTLFQPNGFLEKQKQIQIHYIQWGFKGLFVEGALYSALSVLVSKQG